MVRGTFPDRNRRRILVPALLILAGAQRAAAGPDPPSRTDSVGVSILRVSPADPLQGGSGFAIRYAHSFLDRPSAGPAPGAAAAASRRFLVLKTSLGTFSLDRDANGATKEGEVSLRQLSLGLLASWRTESGEWTLGAGAGADYFSADGKGTYSIESPIGITNQYDVDPGLGYHAEFEATRSLGARWELLLGLGYLFATLDGEHRFVVSGVEGVPEGADFELSGPLANAGIACRF